MNDYVACLNDTLARLLDDVREIEGSASAMGNSTERAFELGRIEALTSSLHTWKNQLVTFGIGPKIGKVWDALNSFLEERGLG